MLTKYFKTQIEKAPEGIELITDISGEAAYSYEFYNGKQFLRLTLDDLSVHLEIIVRGDAEGYEHWVWTQPVEDLYDTDTPNQAVCCAVATALIDEVKAGAELEECLADYHFWQEA